MSNGSRVHGVAELVRKLMEIPKAMRKRVLRNALAAGARVVRDEAKRKAPVLGNPMKAPYRKPGTVRDAIRCVPARPTKRTAMSVCSSTSSPPSPANAAPRAATIRTIGAGLNLVDLPELGGPCGRRSKVFAAGVVRGPSATSGLWDSWLPAQRSFPGFARDRGVRDQMDCKDQCIRQGGVRSRQCPNHHPAPVPSPDAAGLFTMAQDVARRTPSPHGQSLKPQQSAPPAASCRRCGRSCSRRIPCV